jgi:deoxyribodipyrimidine photolyase
MRNLAVPESRIALSNDAPVRGGGDFVLYWMVAFRRTHWNFSLQRAVEWARELRLLREGRIHNYLRMLWGKKVLEWSASAPDAIDVMIELNNRYAVDGRDPNSYSGIFWVLGRYDRPWGPERPVFGTVRYMSSENTRRKLRVESYLRTFR